MQLKPHFESFYQSHQSLANRVCHLLGITLITLAVLGMLVPLQVYGISLVWISLLGALVIDLATLPRLAFVVFGFGVLLAYLGSLMSLPILGIVFVIGWIFQLLGHRVFEKNRPAFTENLIHMHIGPRWLLSHGFSQLGVNLAYVNHLNVSTDGTDVLRWFMAKVLPFLGRFAQGDMEKRVLSIPENQRRLKDQYKVAGKPIQSYSEDLRSKIVQKQEELGGSYAFTSGSTSKPKQILYTKRRLQFFAKSSMRSSLQAFRLLKLNNPCMFVFASLKKDDSFASLVIDTESQGPGFIQGLIEPAKYLNHPLFRDVTDCYGANGSRLLIMLLNSPGAIYATNPSTLAVFFADLEKNLNFYQDMCRDFIDGNKVFSGISESKAWRKLIAGLGRNQYADRIRSFSTWQGPLDFQQLCPDLKGFICWDGGYVTGFLEKVYRFLPPNKFVHIPMFSMSTETIQTEMLVRRSDFHFLTTGEKILYEFIEEGSEDREEFIVNPMDLKVGHNYTMIVSDPWGLERYQTQDVFRCVGKVHGAPDLKFIKRRGLSYSFTGEKLTGEQVSEAIANIRSENPKVRTYGIQFTLIPSQPKHGLPHYILLGAVAGTNQIPKELKGLNLSQAFSHQICGINQEYQDKVHSNRLGPIEFKLLPYDKVALLLDPKVSEGSLKARSWESQFKLTPLTKKPWQELNHSLSAAPH